MRQTTCHARWILPVTSPPVENGRLVVIDGRVAAVERSTVHPTGEDVDFGDAVILPAMVNAHVHLELTACRGRVPYRGSFVAWISDLVGQTRAGSRSWIAESFRQGASESRTGGVTAVADIGHGPGARQLWRASGLHVAGFLEVLGMGPRLDMAHDRSVAEAIGWCAQALPGSLHVVGLSPHAPYSTDTSVYQTAVAYARSTRRPLSTHLAETREEEQFLRSGTGPFRDLLESWGLWDGSFEPPGCSPVEYARRLGLLECGAILAHVNYAGDPDLDILAGTAASVAYCPRTHRFFGHEPHRYRDMLARGINVCLGTDSLAANDTLSILDELRFLRAMDRHTPARTLLGMGTLAGARALGWESVIGSLEPGKRADFLVVPLEHALTLDPEEDLLQSARPPAAVFVDGRRV